MSHLILVVDMNEEVYRREMTAWTKQGFAAVRVNDMNEAMEMLRRKRFLFISINADNIEYLPMLPIMRKTTSTPILVITSNFTNQEQAEALQNGARSYAPFEEHTEENVKLALAKVHQHAQEPKAPEFLIYEKLFLLPDAHQLFYNGCEIHLTKKEFELLHLLLANRGLVISFGTILEKIWHEDSSLCSTKIINNHVSKLRHKLASAPEIADSIKTIRGVGYRFDPN